MIKIRLVCAGSIKDSYLAEGCREYAKRLSAYCDLRIEETPEKSAYGSDTQRALREEGAPILKLLKGYVVALDIAGKKLDSEGFSRLLQEKKTEGVSEFTFVVGGSRGLSAGVLGRADMRLSFSDMTFPHRLFRLLLLEQLYRAFTIENGTPYHK
jgi:23S rRNA (pseudouridine1915-N3)-methyltransferase